MPRGGVASAASASGGAEVDQRPTRPPKQTEEGATRARLFTNGLDATGNGAKDMNGLGAQRRGLRRRVAEASGVYCWMALRGKVYNVTKYLPNPGGRELMSVAAGRRRV